MGSSKDGMDWFLVRVIINVNTFENFLTIGNVFITTLRTESDAISEQLEIFIRVSA